MSITVTCISKSGGFHENPYVAISKFGWVDEVNLFFKRFYTREEMYELVARGGQAYVYDKHGLLKSKLIALISPKGTKYVKTEADDTTRNNLLELEECK